jgi:hypothetical protein
LTEFGGIQKNFASSLPGNVRFCPRRGKFGPPPILLWLGLWPDLTGFGRFQQSIAVIFFFAPSLLETSADTDRLPTSIAMICFTFFSVRVGVMSRPNLDCPHSLRSSAFFAGSHFQS